MPLIRKQSQLHDRNDQKQEIPSQANSAIDDILKTTKESETKEETSLDGNIFEIKLELDPITQTQTQLKKETYGLLIDLNKIDCSNLLKWVKKNIEVIKQIPSFLIMNCRILSELNPNIKKNVILKDSRKTYDNAFLAKIWPKLISKKIVENDLDRYLTDYGAYMIYHLIKSGKISEKPSGTAKENIFEVSWSRKIKETKENETPDIYRMMLTGFKEVKKGVTEPVFVLYHNNTTFFKRGAEMTLKEWEELDLNNFKNTDFDDKTFEALEYMKTAPVQILTKINQADSKGLSSLNEKTLLAKVKNYLTQRK